jgi:hypothetical protein
MQTTVLAPITLGHNAFFGVDHLSGERGSERAAYFADPRRVLDIVEAAHAHGAEGMMMSTHERAPAICRLIAASPNLRQGLRIYPLLPYAQKYVTRANEVGMAGVVMETLSGTSMMGKLNLLWQGSKAVVTSDVNAVLAALMQIELKAFREVNVGAVFLHDGFTDLALAFGMRDVFEFYLAEVPKVCGAAGAFATKNLPTLLERFRGWGLPKPIVMTHFNKAGFHMNPDRASCEAAAAAHEVGILAMGSLASGHLRPDEAYAYLAGVRNIEGVVVGVSRVSHVEETFAAIRRHLFAARTRTEAAIS